MGKVETIEREVQTLSTDELREFRRWFREYDATAWDEQIEDDARKGKLDSLADDALKTIQSGQATEL